MSKKLNALAGYNNYYLISLNLFAKDNLRVFKSQSPNVKSFI